MPLNLCPAFRASAICIAISFLECESSLKCNLSWRCAFQRTEYAQLGSILIPAWHRDISARRQEFRVIQQIRYLSRKVKIYSMSYRNHFQNSQMGCI